MGINFRNLNFGTAIQNDKNTAANKQYSFHHHPSTSTRSTFETRIYYSNMTAAFQPMKGGEGGRQ